MFKLLRAFFLTSLIFVLVSIPFLGNCQISVPQWVDDVGGPGSSSSTPAAVKVDKQNNVYVTGIFTGTVDFDPSAAVFNLTSTGGTYDTYIAKYTPAGALIWAKGFGGNGLDQVNGMSLDDNGNPTVIGQFDADMDADPGPGVAILHNNGGNDGFIVHFDTNGKFLWGKDVGGPSTDYGDKVESDHQGNVIAVLQYNASVTVGSNTYTSAGNFNGLIIKYDPNGNILWSINLSDSGDTECRYIATDANNNLFITGAFGNDVNFNPLGTSHVINGNGNSTFLAKYTPAGILTWVQQINGSVTNNNSNLYVNSQDEVYVDGPFNATITFSNGTSLNPVGTRDIFLSKFGADGTFQIARDVGGSGASLYNYGMAESSDDNIYISGFFNGSVDFDPSAASVALVHDHGYQDLFLAKFDPDLNYKWAISAGSSNCNQTLGRNVAVDHNNDVLLVGTFCSTVNFDASSCSSLIKTAQSDFRDGFVAKYVQSKATTAGQITAFSIPQEVSPAVIDQTKLQITVTVPAGTNITALTPTVTATTGATLSPASGTPQDFSSSVNYNVSKGCNTSLNYSVTVVYGAPVAKPVTTCAGASKIITGDATSPTPDSYTWQLQQGVSWVNATGVINLKDYQTSSLTNGTGSNIIYHLRRQISTGGSISYDSFYDVTVQPVVAIANNLITAPSVTGFCSNGNPSIIAGSTPTGGNGSYSYQWQSSTDNVTFANIAGATAKDYDPPVINITTYYQRIASSGSCNTPSTSNVIKFTVSPAVTNNTITAPAITSFCTSGTPLPITGSTPTGGSGTYTYQWQSSTDNVTFADITGATAKDYDPPVINATTYYRRTVTSGSCATPSNSNVVTLAVGGVPANNTIAPPAITTFCTSGDPAVITGSTPTGGNGAYSYQWQNSADGVTFANIAGATAKDYDSPVINATTYFQRVVTSGACTTPVVSNVVKMTVTVSPAVGNNVITAPAVIGFCTSGDPAVITGSTPTGGNGTYNYQWQSSADNVTFTDITGATAKDYDSPVINTTTYFRRTVTSGTCSAPLASNVVTITITPVAANNTITPPAVTSFCTSGTPAIITGSTPTGGNGTYNYQWQNSADGVTFANITGATAKDYTPSAISATTYYQRQVTSGNCATPLVSNVVKLTVVAAASPLANDVITAPSTTSFCSTAPASTITGSTPTGGSAAYTYQWQSSLDNVTFTNISGATAKDLLTAPANVTTYYRRTVSSGTCDVPVNSNVVALTILSPVTNNVITAPAVTSFCTSGDPALITGSTPTSNGGPFAYQWQSSADNVTFVDIAGATAKDYDPPVINATTYYRRIVTSSTCTTPVISNVVTMTVVTLVANNTITAPAVTTFCATGNPAVITGSTPTGGDGTYAYQWQSSTDNITFANITGATARDYAPTAISTTTYYQRVVTSGGCSTPLTSNVVQITIIPAVANNVITAPAITSFCSNGDPSVITGSTPTGGNGTYTYQWQSSADNVTFADITGATAKDYDPVPVSVTTYYRRTVTSGVCNIPAVSNVVPITIIPSVANNAITAPSITSFCTSGDPSVITGSTPTGGNGTYTYQWQGSADNVTFTNIAGATAKDYDPAPITATTYYRRTVTSGVCNTPLVSNVVTVTVITAIIPVANNVLTAPSVTGFCVSGDPSVITGSTPTGGIGTYNYQWQRSTDNVTFADITGATAKDYDPTAINVTTYYRRNVTSGSCATPVVSNVIIIAIKPALANNSITPPAVTSFCTTGNPSVITGSTPTGGNGTYAYQWQISADNTTFTDINGAVAKDYDPPVITATTYYRRMVSSVVCNVPSASNTVSFIINPSPVTPVPVTSPVLICAGNSATLAVASPQQGLAYNWYDSPAKTNHLFTGVTYVTNPVNASTTFYVEAVSSTCSSLSLATVQVNVTSAPATPLVVNSQVPACSGSMATLSISNPQNGLTYNWYTSATGGSPVYTGVDFVTPPVTTNTTYYAEAANNGGCSSPTRAAVNVTMNPLPQLTVLGAAVCPGSNAVLTASSSTANVTVNWYANAAGGSVIHTGNTYTTSAVTANTNYYAEAVNNTTGCVSASRSLVQATLLEQLTAPVVSVAATSTSSITFQWGAVDGAIGYQVSIDNGQTFSDPSSGPDGLTNTITGLQPNQSVTIIVRATGVLSCQLSTSSTAVTAEAVSALGDHIYVANAFTPNGDGNNDVVYVHSDNIKSLKFYVYDQWGELIFTSLSQQNGWDGTYRGAKEPVGVYVYYLEAIMYSGDKVTKKGSITLLR